MNVKIALGIDLGTTFSAVSIKANGRITEASFPGEGPQLASVVYWADGESPTVGQKGVRAAYKHPEFLYTHFKRRMYDDANNPAYGGHSAIELSAEVLRELLKVIRKSYPDIQQHLDGSKPREHLVIGVTHPASWGVHQTDGIREAGRLAGFEIDAFIPEPNAAAYRLLEETQHHVSQGDLIGVIDIGGGTTDCTVHKWSQGKLDTVVGASGNGLLGGDNITGLIFVTETEKTAIFSGAETANLGV
ncbi:MAG: Hsp70 family protein [Pirellulaceae bacterium]|nr:Hsp70 family protein [Pirellulaceae bacterium]